MSWIDTTFEKEMKAYFLEELGEPHGSNLFAEYTSVRNAMEKDNFFGEIKGAEPNLSDHSQTHICDVFERTFKVIGKDEFRTFNVHEIYCLALMILFHDVGNIFGRDGHNAKEKIAEVYNKYRSNVENYRDERRVITTGASAHSGKSKSDDNDTLKDVSETSLKGNKIDLRELASILRFSDELAEGKQRTCSFLIEKNLLSQESEIYHLYARVTDIQIDRNLERISITYDIDIPKDFDEKAQEDFMQLMLFSYRRAVKLDMERRYTKYYSRVLKAFKYVSIQYNFSYNDIPIEFELSGIRFEDRYPVPGEEFSEKEESAEQLFIKKHGDYDLSKIISSINSIIVN